MEQDIRLVYAAASTQVRISFPLEAVRYDRRPPKDLYKRAKAKLEDELSKGHLEVYDLYEESFATYWSYLRDQHIDDKTVVNFVLAQGFRLYKEIAVRQNPANKEWLLSINASAEHLQKITWPRFAGYIMRQIGIQPYSSPSLQARILEAWHRGLRGEKLKDRPLSAMAVELSDSPSRYAHDKVHGSVFLWIADAKLIQSLADLKTLGIRIQSFLEKNSAVLSGYDTLLKESLESLREMAGMPEVMGFGLPLGLPVALKVIVAAAPEAKNQSHAGKDAQPIGEKKPALAAKLANNAKKSPGKLIEITISEGNLEAHITKANDVILQKDGYDTDSKWLEKYIAEAGIRYGYEAYIDKILNLITMKQSIKGQRIALGIEPLPGDRVSLYPLYLDKNIANREVSVELRSAQNRQIVETGDPIAELRFRDGKEGKDVFGKTVYALVGPTVHTMSIGPGVERRRDGRFYSKIRGVPKLERHMVSCLDVYTHHGDINLKSGDLQFDGAVEVRGNIDNGARVFVKGDLIVRGTIGRSRVRCGGDLRVYNGIISSREGFVHVGGDAHVLFIENSRVIVEGTLEVEQSIINSDCKVGDEILVRSKLKGLIGGGMLVAGKGIDAVNIGFQDGEKTQFRVGSDWRIEHRLSILRNRVVKLKKFVSDRQYEFDDLSKKKAMGERIQNIEKRLKKGRKLLDKLEKIIDIWLKKIRWNDEAIILVHGVLDPNVEITIGGKTVGLQKSIREVMVTGTRYRDQFINSLIYLNQYRKTRTNPGDDMGDGI